MFIYLGDKMEVILKAFHKSKDLKDTNQPYRYDRF